MITKEQIKQLIKFRKKIITEYINKRDMDAFLKTIKDKTNIIIDIRHNVFYKSKQGFNPRTFSEILLKHNIYYYYFKPLGNPYHKEFQEKNQYKEAKAKYNKYLEEDSEAKKTFLTLYNLINSKDWKFCLICFCKTEDPRFCHRFWLLEELVNYKRKLMELPQNYIYEEHVDDKKIDEVSIISKLRLESNE